MNKRIAYAFGLLLLVQTMSAAIYVLPMEDKQEEWQEPVFESGARSNNSSSGCGSNVNYTSVYASAPYMVMENQSFTTSVYVNCEILNATMLIDYWIYDSSNSTVFSGNQSWNGTSSSISNFTSSVSGLSVGNYTFHADLYVDGTWVDSDADSFMVYANNSGGGGNNGGNQTSPCGSNVNYTYVSAYAPYMVMENQSFTTSVYVNCEILNATMLIDYWIYDTNNNTVFSGNQSWTGSNISSSNFNSSVSGLSAGYYVFHADLYVDGTWVDSDADSFMVYANNSGGGGNNGGSNTSSCGDNVSDVWFEVSPYQEEWNASDTVSVYLDTYCGIWNNSYMVSWGLIDNANNSTIDYGSTSFMTTPTSVSYHPNHTYHFNEFDIHLYYMETGNYTVFGQFSVWSNNSWSLLSNQSTTFVVNTTMTTTVCGFNSTFIDMKTDTQSTLYYSVASVHPWSDIECPMLNTPYIYTWEMYNLNTSTVTHSGLQNFTATWQNVNMFTDGSGFYFDLYPHAYDVMEGTYLLNTTLLSASGDTVDTSNISFSVWANPSNYYPEISSVYSNTDNYSSSDEIDLNWIARDLDNHRYVSNSEYTPMYNVTVNVRSVNPNIGAFTSSELWENFTTFTPGGANSSSGTFYVPANYLSTDCYYATFELYEEPNASLGVDSLQWDFGTGFYFGVNAQCSEFGWGNGTGGNNTGGNTGNNTGGNNTGGNNTGGNNTGGNTTTGVQYNIFNMEPEDCIQSGDELHVTMIVYAGPNQEHTLDWQIVAANGVVVTSWHSQDVTTSSNGSAIFNWDLDTTNLSDGSYYLRAEDPVTGVWTTWFWFEVGCTGCGYDSSFTNLNYQIWSENFGTIFTTWNESIDGTGTSSNSVNDDNPQIIAGNNIAFWGQIECIELDQSYLLNYTVTNSANLFIMGDEEYFNSSGSTWYWFDDNVSTTLLPAGEYCITLTLYVSPFGSSDIMFTYTDCVEIVALEDWDGCGSNLTYLEHLQTVSGNPFVQQNVVFLTTSNIWVNNFVDCLVIGESYTMETVVTSDGNPYLQYSDNFTVNQFSDITQWDWQTISDWQNDIDTGNYCVDTTIYSTDSTYIQQLATVSSVTDCFAVVNATMDNWWDNQDNGTGNGSGTPNDPVLPDTNCTELNGTLSGLNLTNSWNISDCENGTGFWFNLTVNGSGVTWYDPIYAVGYDYEVISGPKFSSVVVPPGYGDDKYDIYLWDGTEYVLAVSDLDALTEYWFTDDGGLSTTPGDYDGISKFSIRGLEISEKLDPEDPDAFVTGLSFVQDPNEIGEVILSMNPITVSDEDDDGIIDEEDNCVNTENTNQTDSDGDGVGDACEESQNASAIDDNDLDSDDGTSMANIIAIFAVCLIFVMLFMRGRGKDGVDSSQETGKNYNSFNQ